MKKLFNFRLLVLIGVLIMSINQMWADDYYVRGADPFSWDNGTIMTNSSVSTNVYYLEVYGSREFKIVNAYQGWSCSVNKGSGDVKVAPSDNVTLGGSGNITGGGNYTWYICYDTSDGKVYGTTANPDPSYPDMCIAGNGWGGLAEWANNGGSMTNNGDGTYSWTSTSVTANTDCRFKICLCGTWTAVGYSNKVSGTNCSSGPSGENGDGSNICFQPAGTGTVTITYDSESGNVTITCAASETTYSVTCYAGAHGSITAKDTPIAANSSATVQVGATARSLSATPAGGYYFAGWTKTGSVTIADASSTSTTMTATGTGTVTAHWAEFTLTAPSSSRKTLHYAGNPLTISVHSSLPDGCTNIVYSYEYKLSGGSWNAISPASSSVDGGDASCVWTTPSETDKKVYQVRAKLTYSYGGSSHTLYTTASTDITVVGTGRGSKTIKVKKPSEWDNFDGFYLWNTDGLGEGWPGYYIQVTHLGGKWYEVVVPEVSDFIFNNGIGDGSSNPTKYQTVDLTYSSITTGNCYVLDNKTDASDGNYSPQKTYKYNLTHTDDCPEEPTVSSSAASSVTNTSATLNGSISDNGNDDITDYGFYWSTDANDDTAAEIAENGTKVQKGTSDMSGSFTHSLTVTAGTTYRYIAYATNGLGTTLSTVQTFTAPYNVTISTATGCSALDPAAGDYLMAVGDNVSATATAGYTFSNWSATNVTLGSPTTTNGVTTSSISSFSADNATIAPVYTENKTSITITTDGHGTITTPSPNESPYSLGVATTQAINASPSTGYSWSTWTTSGTAALGSSATTQSNTAKGDGTNGGSGTITATFTPNPYDVILDVNGGSGDNQTVTATFDAAMPTTLKGGSDPIAARTKTGYNFDGYWSTTTGTGTQYYTSALASNHIWDVATNEMHIYAKWNAKSCDVVFDFDESDDGYGSKTVATAGTTATYDASMTSVTPPTAAEGYAFMGYFTAADGGGTQYYDGHGNSAANWAEDTESETTLYAYYKKAEITEITFTGGAVVAPNTSKTVTATISPTPTGTTTVCWRVLYSNDNPLDPQPEFSSVSGNSVSFTAPEASGMYKIEAVLHTGSGCAGTELSTYVANFQVAGDHTVTVQYKDASGNVIAASGSVTGKPLEWSEEAITAPDIFGYTFHHWAAGDGVTLSKDGASALGKDTAQVSTIYIQAVYDGRLTAVYNKDNIIYFVDNLGWTDPEDEDAHVYLNLLSGSYWDSDQGSGNKNVTNRNLSMDRLPGTTNIFYYNYGNKTITKWVSFTKNSYEESNSFYEESLTYPAEVVYPTNPTNASTEPAAGQYYGFNAGTPMFVPLSKSEYEGQLWNNSHARYFNRGYWRYYDPTSGDANTGYNLIVYNQTEGNASRKVLHLVPFTNSGVDGQVFKATVELEAATGYGIKFKRDNDWVYTHTTGHLHRTGDVVETEKEGEESYKAIYLLTTAAGKYDFIITCNGDGKLCIQATFPAAAGDYRVLYTDNATWSNGAHTAQSWYHPSRVISAEANAEDIISFFVAKDNSPQYKIEKITGIDEETGGITWTQVQAWTDISVDATGVYNFKITQNAAGDGISSVENLGEYTGNYYIRTDCAGSTKWDNYKTADHMMTYSEYSKEHSDYTHYYMKFVDKDRENGKYKNVKFTIANDYSPCVSDTLAQQAGDITPAHVDDGGVLAANANIRFMWDMRNNKLQRAYLAEGKDDGSKFLVLRANSNTDMLDKDGNALINSANSGEAGYNHKAPDNSIQFVDNENWIYEANVKIKPGAFVKLYAHFHDADFYFKGVDNSTFDEGNAIKLMDGSGDAELVRVIYDFKTDRLVSAWQPSGNISTERAINADVMFVREHQGDITQLTFTESGAITKITTAYAVLRFNKWTLNNKSKEGGHAVLNPGASRYERDLFYVSFPFRVSMNEVFGFGTYGQHWIIEEYDGAARAANGFWADTPTYWRFITDRKGKFFEPNQGYIIALDLDELGESSSIWDNDVENVELYFPSYGTMGDITKASVEHTLPSHECTINRPTPDGNRTIKDSHWNVMSVPTYVNTSAVSFTNTDWTATRPSFLYEWNMDDNSLTPRSGSGYTYHAMHAYIVQYNGKVTWTSTSVTPASIVARRSYAEKPSEVEFRLELSQDDQIADQTYVRLSDDEEVSAGFAFGEDMSKEFNKTRSNIYTFVGTEQVAGNVLPMTEQTTVIPVGVKIAANGDYTFAIPEGTDGVGVTLFDTETGIYTQLGALDYTIYLNAGTYDNRFILNISPIKQTPTDVELINGGNGENDVRKVLIDDLLYIVKDGKMFDAQGKRLQ